MAKKQSFADKSKAKAKAATVTVKVVKAMKTDKGSYKFNEKYMQLSDINKVTEIK